MDQSTAMTIHQPVTTSAAPEHTTVTTTHHVPSSSAVAVHVPQTAHRQPIQSSIPGTVSSSTETLPLTPTIQSSATSNAIQTQPPKSVSVQSQGIPSATPQTTPSHHAGVKQAQAPFRSSPTQSYQSKYGELLNVIEDLGREIKPTYAGSKMAQERLKKGIMHARALVRECLAEVEKSARQ